MFTIFLSSRVWFVIGTSIEVFFLSALTERPSIQILQWPSIQMIKRGRERGGVYLRQFYQNYRVYTKIEYIKFHIICNWLNLFHRVSTCPKFILDSSINSIKHFIIVKTLSNFSYQLSYINFKKRNSIKEKLHTNMRN
jgi:hypothetical protein